MFALDHGEEGWDVEDARGVRYQLWLYCAEGGQLFEAGTTNSVAYVAQGAFWTKDGAPSTLGAELDAAKRAAKKAIRGSELAGVAFVAREPGRVRRDRHGGEVGASVEGCARSW